MKRNIRRVAAGLLSAVVVMGSAVVSYAGEPEADQASEARGDIIQVVLPTNVTGIFDFILDPQKLICKTNAEAHEGKKFEEGATLFFERLEEEAEEDYSSTSDAVTFTNKGSVPVDIVVTADISVSSSDEIKMTDDREFTDDTEASVYLALTDGEMTVPIIAGEGASIRATIPAASGETDGDGAYSFRLTGAANEKGDWDTLEDIALGVTVTWVITANEEALPENENGKQPVEQNKEASSAEKGAAAATPSTATPSTATPSAATESEIPDQEKEESAVPSRNAVPYGLPDRAGDLSDEIPRYILKEGKSLTIELNRSSGETAATGVISVREKGSGRELLDDSEWALYDNGQVTLSAAYVDSCLADKSFERETLVIAFDDTGLTTAEVILERGSIS